MLALVGVRFVGASFCVRGQFVMNDEDYKGFDTVKHRKMWRDQPHRLVERSYGPEGKETSLLCSEDDNAKVRTTIVPATGGRCSCGCGQFADADYYAWAKRDADDRPDFAQAEFASNGCKQRAHRHRRAAHLQFVEDRLADRSAECFMESEHVSLLAADVKQLTTERNDLDAALRAAQTELATLQHQLEGTQPS